MSNQTLFDRVNRIDDAAWIMQYGNNPNYGKRFVENMQKGEIRVQLVDYWQLAHELLWKERREHPSKKPHERELYRRISLFDDCDFLMEDAGAGGIVCWKIVDTMMEDGEVQNNLLEYWRLAHELLWKEKHAAVVRRDMPPDAA